MSIKASVFIATSRDGFIARANGDLNWLIGAENAPPEQDYGYQDFMDSVDTIVLGRNTFELALTFEQPGAPQFARSFTLAAEQAAGVLVLYEAVLNGDEDKARTAIFEEFPFVGIWWFMYNEVPNKAAHMDREWVAAQISETAEETLDGDYLRYALELVTGEVEDMVRRYCSPALSIKEGSRDPSGVTANWIFMSLLGAMYLQMYWLMAAGGNVTRCKYCGRIISLASPAPDARKTRQDKKFCDDACRQRYHYHTKTKPKRQGKSS